MKHYVALNFTMLRITYRLFLSSLTDKRWSDCPLSLCCTSRYGRLYGTWGERDKYSQ